MQCISIVKNPVKILLCLFLLLVLVSVVQAAETYQFVIPIPDPLQKVSLISYRNLLRNTPKNLDLNLRN